MIVNQNPLLLKKMQQSANYNRTAINFVLMSYIPVAVDKYTDIEHLDYETLLEKMKMSLNYKQREAKIL